MPVGAAVQGLVLAISMPSWPGGSARGQDPWRSLRERLPAEHRAGQALHQLLGGLSWTTSGKTGQAPFTVTVLPARVELGKSFDTPPLSQAPHLADLLQSPRGSSLNLSQADLALSPTLSFLAESPWTRLSAPKPQSPQL